MLLKPGAKAKRVYRRLDRFNYSMLTSRIVVLGNYTKKQKLKKNNTKQQQVTQNKILNCLIQLTLRQLLKE